MRRGLPVILPQQLGFHAASPRGTIKPHRRATKQELDDDPGDGDDSKRLQQSHEW